MTETASHNQLTRKETPQVTVRTLLAITATVAILVGVASLFHSHSKPYDQHVGMWVNPFAACIAIYFWRFRISQLPSRRMRVAMFSILVALTLPFIYWTGALLADWSRISVSKWLGDPVWVYTVPILSFLALDLRNHRRNRRSFLVVSAFELFVAIPAWTVICLLWQAHFNWFQMG